MAKIQLALNEDGSMFITGMVTSENGKDRGHFSQTIPPGTGIFGVTYEDLVYLAETKGYLDFDEYQSQQPLRKAA